MLALERLSPLERAAFLLHDVFGLDSRRLRQRSTATRRLAATSRLARALTSAQPSLVCRWKNNVGSRSLKWDLMP